MGAPARVVRLAGPFAEYNDDTWWRPDDLFCRALVADGYVLSPTLEWVHAGNRSGKLLPQTLEGILAKANSLRQHGKVILGCIARAAWHPMRSKGPDKERA